MVTLALPGGLHQWLFPELLDLANSYFKLYGHLHLPRVNPVCVPKGWRCLSMSEFFKCPQQGSCSIHLCYTHLSNTCFVTYQSSYLLLSFIFLHCSHLPKRALKQMFFRNICVPCATITIYSLPGWWLPWPCCSQPGPSWQFLKGCDLLKRCDNIWHQLP